MHPSRLVWDIPQVAWHLSLDYLLLKEWFQEKNFSWEDTVKTRKPFLGSILEHSTELEDRGECVVALALGWPWKVWFINSSSVSTDQLQKLEFGAIQSG